MAKLPEADRKEDTWWRIRIDEREADWLSMPREISTEQLTPACKALANEGSSRREFG